MVQRTWFTTETEPEGNKDVWSSEEDKDHRTLLNTVPEIHITCPTCRWLFCLHLLSCAQPRELFAWWPKEGCMPLETLGPQWEWGLVEVVLLVVNSPGTSHLIVKLRQHRSCQPLRADLRIKWDYENYTLHEDVWKFSKMTLKHKGVCVCPLSNYSYK